MRVKLKIVKRTTARKSMDPRRLKEENIYEETKLKINDSLRKVKEDNTETVNVDHKWEKIQNALVSVGRETLKPLREKIKSWMTVEILDLMEERRRYKNKNVNKYKEVQRNIRKKSSRRKRKVDTQQM